jgi:DNA-binding transcriptional LysR family regulator
MSIILLCFWTVKELGLSETLLAQKLGTTQPGVSRALQRGERLAADEGLTFDIDDGNA